MSSPLNLSKSEINTLYPICGLTIYEHALVLRRYSNEESPKPSHVHLRGKTERLSARSRTNFVLKVMLSNVRYLSLLTLSYGQNFPTNGRQVKSDLNAFFTSFKREFGPVKYFWFLEFQRRGAPHFHIGLNIGPPKDEDRRVMADIWARIAEKYNWLYCSWPAARKKHKLMDGIFSRDAVRAVHSYPDAWEEIREKDGAIRYLVSYATKPYQKTVPPEYSDVGRFWGMSRVDKPQEGVVLGGSEQDVKELLKELGRDFDGWELLPKIIFY